MHDRPPLLLDPPLLPLLHLLLRHQPLRHLHPLAAQPLPDPLDIARDPQTHLVAPRIDLDHRPALDCLGFIDGNDRELPGSEVVVDREPLGDEHADVLRVSADDRGARPEKVGRVMALQQLPTPLVSASHKKADVPELTSAKKNPLDVIIDPPYP